MSENIMMQLYIWLMNNKINKAISIKDDLARIY